MPQRVVDMTSNRRKVLSDKRRERGEASAEPDLSNTPVGADGERIAEELRQLQAHAPGWHLRNRRP